jgi:hypothetical protein
VASNGNVWVAGGEDPNRTKNMFFSTDGKKWAPVTPPGSARNDIVNGIVWDGTYFIAVGEGFADTTTAVWSADGEKWIFSKGEVVKIQTTVAFSALGCNEEICVALSMTKDKYSRIIFSKDHGVSWEKATGNNFSDITGTGTFVSVNKNKHWVAISKKSTKTNILISSTGTEWKLPENNIFVGTQFDLHCVAHDNGSNWVVVGKQGIGYSSDNGEKWYISEDFIGKNFSSVIYNGKIWIATCDFIVYSTDNGKSWLSYNTSAYQDHLCWNGTVYVSGGFRQPAIKSSNNLIEWTNTTSSVFNITSKNQGIIHNIACRYKV